MSTPPQKPPRPQKPPFSSIWTQMFPPRPEFTEKDISDLSGKVYLVTGSNTGVGKQIAHILFSKNAKVYMGARSETKAEQAITDIKSEFPNSTGSLIYLHLDFADLSTIKPSVQQFVSQEDKLHALFNNAAVQALAAEPPNNVTKQNHEIHLGVNILAPFLLTKLLTPLLTSTAKSCPASNVRVVWVSSLGLEMIGETSYGITTNYIDYWPTLTPLERYGYSKAGAWLYGVEFARRYKAEGVVSVPCNPGHLRSDLYRDGGEWFKWFIGTVVAYPAIYGAYTELFCAFSEDITIEKTGEWVVPWGRPFTLREDLSAAMKTEEEGGNGHARKFWEWSEEQVKEFA